MRDRADGVCCNEPLPVMQLLHTALTSQALQHALWNSTYNYWLFPQGAMCCAHVGVTVHPDARSHYIPVSSEPQNLVNSTTVTKNVKNLRKKKKKTLSLLTQDSWVLPWSFTGF